MPMASLLFLTARVGAIGLLALQLCLPATAQVLARRDHQAREEAISIRYVAAHRKCAALGGHPRNICVAEASAQARTARAELDARDRPSAQARRRALDVAADSRYAVDRARCDARARTARSGCVADADAARLRSRAEARVLLRAAQDRASASAGEESARRLDDASGAPNPGRHAEARTQCGGYTSGGTRTLCLEQAGKRFGKPD